MEKYAIDIDQVLNEFEANEALEESKQQKDIKDESKSEDICQLVLSNNSLLNQASSSSSLSEHSYLISDNNSKHELDLPQETDDLLPIKTTEYYKLSVTAGMTSQQTFSKPFHSTLCSMEDKNGLPAINSNFQIPVTSTLDNNVISHIKPIFSTSPTSYKGSLYEPLNNAIETTDSSPLCESNSESEFDNKCSDSERAMNDKMKSLQTSDIDSCATLAVVSAEYLSDHQKSNEVLSDTPNATNSSNFGFDQERSECSNLSHSLCESSNKSQSEEKDQAENVVSFSSIPEIPQISLEEMNEYLNDISNSDQGQDEDSGVSSQEDVNGNNINVFKENEAGENINFCLPERKWELDQNIKQHNFFSTKSTVFEKDQNSSGFSEVVNQHDTYSSEDTNIQDIDLLPSRSSKQQLNMDINTSNYANKINSADENSIPCTFNTESIDSNAHVLDSSVIEDLQISNEVPEVQQSNNQLYQTEVCDFESPQMKLLFSPCDGTFRSIPLNEAKLENEDSEKKVFNSSHGKSYVDTATVFHGAPHSSRLQRPTTLNIPCRDVATANIVTSYVDASSSVVPESISEDISTNAIPDALCPGNEVLSSQIGHIKPFWIPDSNAPNCMHCNIKFTVIKRRHHCRACGKVLCSRCCNQKARLPYLSNKEDRVCQQCVHFISVNEAEREKEENGDSPSSCGSSPSFTPSSASSNLQQKKCKRPHPNNPDDYCSTVSPFQQVQELGNRPPPTVMVPVGVLKRGNKPRGEPKQVIFSDGIRPGGDLTDVTESVDAVPYRWQGRRCIDKCGSGDISQANSHSFADSYKKKMHIPKTKHTKVIVSDADGLLPPILLPSEYDGQEMMDIDALFSFLQDEAVGPVIFAVTKNMHVLAKIIKLDCCFGKECWSFTSHGFCTVGQDEIVLLLERFQNEDVLPRDVFKIFSKIYDDAGKGLTVGELGHLIFPDGIFGSWEHRGFLFVRPTFQCLSKLILPNTPYLFAILIQKWEVPWAKVFPLRLMLRLGADCRYYPCSLVSIRFREPVYFEIGQTIMSLLTDLRNFQFTIPFVPGLVVHMEEKKTYVNIPKNRYEKLMKVLNSNNVEHVLALGCSFSTEADSHLVCIQRDEGDYQAQAINIEHTTRKVTGASFIVFSEALKSTTGLSAKFKIVEDGLLVEIPQETMSLLHCALKDMHDLTIKCGHVNAPEPEELVIVRWTCDDKKLNIGVISPVDKRSLEGMSSLRIHTSTDYAGDSYLIRWTEVFFLEFDKNVISKRTDAIDPCRLAENVSQAFCMALIPYLDSLTEADMTKIGLRITLDAKKDMVEYDVGSLGQNLPSVYMNALDSSLIPVLSRITLAHQEEAIAMELIFYILAK